MWVRQNTNLVEEVKCFWWYALIDNVAIGKQSKSIKQPVDRKSRLMNGHYNRPTALR